MPEAAGHRFILDSEALWYREVSQAMADEFNHQGYNVSTKEMWYSTAWFASFFIKELCQVIQTWG